MRVSHKCLIKNFLESMSPQELNKALSLIKILEQSGNLSKSSINHLMKLLEQLEQSDPEYIVQLSVKGISSEKIEKSLKNILPKHESHQVTSTDEMKLEVQWGGYHYKRSLDEDLKTLLN